MNSGCVSWGDDTRGQSEVIGVVLLLAITIAGATAIVAFGAVAVNDTERAATTSAAEQSMTQLDSRASLVAHGQSDSQRVTLSGASDATRRVDPDAGWMNITVRNRSTDAVKTQVMNKSLGAVVYEDGNERIAYQGGGVWRSSTNNSSTMVSPPEFHYEGTTLTLPLVLVRGDGTVGKDVRVRQDGAVSPEYPTSSRTNPLEDGVVAVEVHSEYYHAWGRFFEQRTDGNVTYDHSADTVRINLTVPFDENFENVVASTTPGGITTNGADPIPTPYETGVSAPLPDSKIEDKITYCEGNPSCTEVSSPSSLSAGTYFWNDSDLTSGFTIDTSGGDVILVVDGKFDPSGSIDVTGSNNVTVYVRENMAVSEDVNAGGDPSAVRVLVHSDGDISFNGNFQFFGAIYAPGSEVDYNGGGSTDPNIKGSIVADTMDINGDPNDFEYDSSVRGISFGLSTNAPKITYLHVSTTEVNVTST